MKDDVRTTKITKPPILTTFLTATKFSGYSAIFQLLLLLINQIGICNMLASTSTSSSSSADFTNLRRGLLRRFGLEHLPVEKSLKRGESIPQHVWDIYENLGNDVDWIRHYYPKEIIENHDGFVLAYNLSVAARNAHSELVREAVLKLRLRRRDSKTRGNFSVFVFQDQKPILITDGFLKELDGSSDWIDFDVTDAFYQTSSAQNDSIQFLISLSDGLELSADEKDRNNEDQVKQHSNAPLIVFSDQSEKPRRRKRSAQTGTSERKNRKKGRKHHSFEAESNLCRKTELYVDFDELGWQDWIMAPKGYEAGQCQGSCPNPMPAQLNASNHAIIQSLLHSLNPEDVPPPCCIPTETSPLSILYMDIDNVIVIKEYADMRVESCGCR